jgi:hypothetical protein
MEANETALSDAYKDETRTIHRIIPTAAGMNLLEKTVKKNCTCGYGGWGFIPQCAREHRRDQDPESKGRIKMNSENLALYLYYSNYWYLCIPRHPAYVE